MDLFLDYFFIIVDDKNSSRANTQILKPELFKKLKMKKIERELKFFILDIRFYLSRNELISKDWNIRSRKRVLSSKYGELKANILPYQNRKIKTEKGEKCK